MKNAVSSQYAEVYGQGFSIVQDNNSQNLMSELMTNVADLKQENKKLRKDNNKLKVETELNSKLCMLSIFVATASIIIMSCNVIYGG